jgi:hypothetical protein
MIGSGVLLALLLLATAAVVQQWRSMWIVLLAAIPVVWDVAGVYERSGLPGFVYAEPVTSFEGLITLLVLYGAYSGGWLAPKAQFTRIDGLLLFAMYLLNVAVFVWLQVVPLSVVGELDPFFHMVVIGILPIIEFRLLRSLIERGTTRRRSS